MPDRHDRPGGRRRPFSTWMKKLASFKNSSHHHGSSSAEGGHGGHGHSRRILYQMKTQGKRHPKNNNPYPHSGRIGPPHLHNSLPSFSTNPSGITSSVGSPDHSPRSSLDGLHAPTTGARSTIAPTISTEHEASHSIMAPSHGGTSTIGTRTVGGGHESRRGGDSTFSSPAPSVRSLTTTLTTIQSLSHNGNATGASNHSAHTHHAHQTQQNSIHFSQPFPTTSVSPASAIPAHLAPHPTTYTSATANNLLTDNASILTLASSSKRRRRRSFDTDASVRALAPSSLWGGSRESLPLSVLSGNIDSGVPPTSGLHSSSRMAERTSIYSATGITPALNSERNSFYAKQSITGAGDATSVRSGLFGHTRADSTTGSTAGLNSPLISPREENVLGKDDMKEDEAEISKLAIKCLAKEIEKP